MQKLKILEISQFIILIIYYIVVYREREKNGTKQKLDTSNMCIQR